MKLTKEDTLSPRDLPADCIAECSASGDVTASVEFWVSELALEVDPSEAREYLDGYGAWDDDDYAAWTPKDYAMRILWLACCQISEDTDHGSTGPIWYYGI